MLTTVHSGRRAVASAVVAAGVMDVLAVEELPQTWLSPPSGANYAVMLSGRRIGAVHLGQAQGEGSVLGVD